MRSIFPATLSFEFLQSVFSFLGCSSKKQHMMIAVATMQTNTVWTRMIPVVYSIFYLKKNIIVKIPKVSLRFDLRYYEVLIRKSDKE